MTRRAASLTGSLMARKGTAGPSHLELEDADLPEGRPAPPRLVRSSEGKAKRKSAAKRKSSEAAATKRRFTLRLSEDEHIRMRLASIHLHMSAQQMVMAALDKYMAATAPHIRGGDCSCIEDEGDGCSSKKSSEKGKK
jgi:hypothetical protein